MSVENQPGTGGTTAPGSFGPPPQEQRTNVPFNIDILNHFRALAAEMLTQHPELRSVCLTLDFKGSLNTAKIDNALWLGETGAVERIDAIMGSIDQTLNLLGIMFLRADDHAVKLRTDLINTSKSLYDRRMELAAVSTSNPAGTGEAPSPPQTG